MYHIEKGDYVNRYQHYENNPISAANGNVIKSYTGNDWLPVNYFTNTDQSVEIKKLKKEDN